MAKCGNCGSGGNCPIKLIPKPRKEAYATKANSRKKDSNLHKFFSPIAPITMKIFLTLNISNYFKASLIFKSSEII